MPGNSDRWTEGRKQASKQAKREDWTDRRKENRHNFDLLSQGIPSIVAGKCGGRNHRGLTGHVPSAGGKQSVEANAQHPCSSFFIYRIDPWDGADYSEPNPDNPPQLTNPVWINPQRHAKLMLNTDHHNEQGKQRLSWASLSPF